MEFDKQTYIGIVFDVQGYQEGMRVLDSIKNALVGVAMKLGMGGRIYVASNKLPPRNQGESVYQVSAYEPPDKFSLDLAFKETLAVLGNNPADGKRHLFFFTDRYTAAQKYRYEKGLMMNDIRGYDCAIHFFGFGKEYDRPSLNELANEYDAKLTHIDALADLPVQLSEIVGD